MLSKHYSAACEQYSGKTLANVLPSRYKLKGFEMRLMNPAILKLVPPCIICKGVPCNAQRLSTCTQGQHSLDKQLACAICVQDIQSVLACSCKKGFHTKQEFVPAFALIRECIDKQAVQCVLCKEELPLAHAAKHYTQECKAVIECADCPHTKLTVATYEEHVRTEHTPCPLTSYARETHLSKHVFPEWCDWAGPKNKAPQHIEACATCRVQLQLTQSLAKEWKVDLPVASNHTVVLASAVSAGAPRLMAPPPRARNQKRVVRRKTATRRKGVPKAMVSLMSAAKRARQEEAAIERKYSSSDEDENGMDDIIDVTSDCDNDSPALFTPDETNNFDNNQEFATDSEDEEPDRHLKPTQQHRHEVVRNDGVVERVENVDGQDFFHNNSSQLAGSFPVNESHSRLMSKLAPPQVLPYKVAYVVCEAGYVPTSGYSRPRIRMLQDEEARESLATSMDLAYSVPATLRKWRSLVRQGVFTIVSRQQKRDEREVPSINRRTQIISKLFTRMRTVMNVAQVIEFAEWLPKFCKYNLYSPEDPVYAYIAWLKEVFIPTMKQLNEQLQGCTQCGSNLDLPENRLVYCDNSKHCNRSSHIKCCVPHAKLDQPWFCSHACRVASVQVTEVRIINSSTTATRPLTEAVPV